MAANSSDSCHHITIPSINQISKDVHDNPIPLSPQWLLPKPGESKLGAGTGESHISPLTANGSHSETLKSAGGGEEMHDTTRKKDVFRPSLLDMETGRRERWREEERDTNSSLRKDRWRKGDNDFGDTHKMDKWTENSPSRHHGEAHRATERWTDSGNKDSNFDQRRDSRESKWNSRWGPGDKDSDGLREKWTDLARDGDIPLDKGSPLLSSHGKDEKEVDHHRPWRSTSSLSRGRGETPHQALTPNKQATFSYGRGRGEKMPSSFIGRSRASNGGNLPQSLRSLPEKFESGHGEPSPLRYSRTKLLDVYRMTDLRLHQKIMNEFEPVSPLTLEEPIEPLGLCAPNQEEMLVLKGIEKGDIISSGAPQLSKDGSIGRNTLDSTQPTRTKLGSRDDSPLTNEDNNDGSTDNSKAGFLNHAESSSHEKKPPYQVPNLRTETMQQYAGYPHHKLKAEVNKEESSPYKNAGELPLSKEFSFQENKSSQPGTWRASHERSRAAPYGWRENLNDPLRSKPLETGGSQAPINQWENKLGGSSYPKDDVKWKTSEDGNLQRQPPAVTDRQEAGKISQSSPEDLVLYYKDPQGNVQGPFSGSDIIGWFETGYFGLDLQVCLASASKDSPFSLLGDVMPHLRTKGGPPPGFSVPKSNEKDDSSNMSNLASFGNVQASTSEIGLLRNEPRQHGSTVSEAEKRYLESLMAGDSVTSSQGLQGYNENNSGGVPLAVDGGKDMYRLAREISLERQKSMPSPYPWTGQNAPPMVSKSEDAMPHAQFRSSMPDNSRLPSHSQNTDFMFILQGLSDRQAPGINAHNFSSQAAFGIQQQRLQGQEPPPLANLPSNIMTPQDKLLSTGQDPQVLNVLQQQYLLQLQSSATNPAQQLLLLDKLLYLKQQQKQEEQQQLLRQQQLLSQVLSEQNSQRRFSDMSFGTAIPTGNVPVNPPGLQSSQELFHLASQVPVPMAKVEHATNSVNSPSQIPHPASQSVSLETSSLRLPHQMFGNTNQQKSWGITVPKQFDNIQNMDSPMPSILSESIWGTDETMENGMSGVPTSAVTYEDAMSMLEPTSERKVPRGGPLDEQQVQNVVNNDEPSVTTMVQNVEVKKVAEKKSKKKKSSKSNTSDLLKGASKTSSLQQMNQTESECSNVDTKSEMRAGGETEAYPSKISGNTVTEYVDFQHSGWQSPANYEVENVESWPVESVVVQNAQTSLGQRVWKPAPGFKVKSLLEIQQEEQRIAQQREQQRKAYAEMNVSDITSSVNSMSLSSPWAGVVANSDIKPSKEDQNDSRTSLNTKSKKSQLHDVLAKEVFAQANEWEVDIPVSVASQVVPAESLDEDNFIEAKDAKKSRKKSSKSKGTGSKVTVPSAVVEVPLGTSPGDKIKSFRQEKEVLLPAIPSGPSLGDFVLWKGGELVSSAPAPAWSTDSKKLAKPTSLRDILKEQEKKTTSSVQAQIQTATPQKLQQTQVTQAAASKAASTIHSSSHTSQPKSEVDDDLFWGPSEQSNQKTKQTDFPNFTNQSNWGTKSTPIKSTSSRQKSVGGRVAEHSLSSSPVSSQSLPKGKKQTLNKNSEAMDFRDWCESECVRLIGSKDTSFLEFCLKQSRSEAEMYLIENLGSFDPDHKFIDKFLNYKELLPADVLEIAAQGRNDHGVTGSSTREMKFENGEQVSVDVSAKTGGKKKGKKGKKVSPLVLGFNVVSNRIMMGEIQKVED